MKFLSNLFNKTPEPQPTLEERIARLNAGSADEEALCVAAIAELPDGVTLRVLAGVSGNMDESVGASGAPLKRAAQTRLAHLIDSKSVDFAALCADAPLRPAVYAVAALCGDSSHLSQALATLRDPEQIGRLVIESPSSRVRQTAAELIEEPAQLQQLLQQVRNKDKSVYKVLKQKSDALTLKEREAEAIRSDIAELYASLERHSRRSYDAFYRAALEGLKNRWQTLPTQPDADIDQRAKQAVERCEEVIRAHEREISQRAAEAAALEAARDLQERERQAALAVAAAQAEEAAAAQAREREEAAAIRAAEERQRAEKRAAEEDFHRQITGLIRMAQAAVRDGGTQRAAGLRKAIEEKLTSGFVLPAQLSRQIQQLDEKLNELKEWKDYAAAPKRLELIADMEALIGSAEDPQALADRIKALQQDWRTVSKGIVSESPEEWQRFQQASQAAYKPCGEYFEAQAKLRQKNLDQRKAVFDRLLTFEAAQSADAPDWRLLESVLREAPREWRRHFPVERERVRELQTGFDAALGRLQAKLDAWYEGNVADKQSLIKRARHLLSQEDSREAIDAVKRLQLSWKETGPAPGSQSQSLWNEFREVCDSVFQKRQQAYAQYNAQLEANKLKAAALCEEVEAAANLSGAALLEAVAKIPAWRTSFEAIDDMPKADARGLQNRFLRAIDACKAREVEQRACDAEQSFTDLFEAAGHVQAYEWAAIRGAAAQEREVLKQAAENYIAGVQLWPKGSLKVIREALAGADSVSGVDLPARERALRILCIRGEIENDLPTPASDDEVRRQYQVQRLMRAMGQGMSADDGGRDAITLEWIRTGAVAPDLHETLRGRFLDCWKTRRRRS